MDNERGFALAVAIFALVVVGALVAGGFYIGLQEQRMGRNAIGNQQAFHAAEAGIEVELSNWNSITYNALANGDVSTFTRWLPDSSGWYRGRVRRMSKYIYFLETEGFSRDSASRAHLGMLTRLRPLEIEIGGAVETQGQITLSGNATITGVDADPTGWTGCPVAPDDSLPGILTNDTSAVKGSNIDGDPPYDQDSTITDSSLTNFGDYTFDDLRDLASIVFYGNQNLSNSVQPVASGGTCTTSTMTNWGEPGATVTDCRGYFPVIYIDGDLIVNGRRGQGVLIVNGDFNIQGGFEFAGPVIVRGDLDIRGAKGSPTRLSGGVIAANVSAGKNAFSGNSSISYSFCAIDRALRSGALSKPLRERSWVNLY
jgi:hypothetical protein